MLELAADQLAARKERKNGSDPGCARKKALVLSQAIDRLLTEREAAVNALDANDPDRAVSKQEGLLLKDMRDLADNEFARFYSQAKGGRLTRNLGYILSALSNAESGAGSAYASLYAPYRIRRDSRTRTRNGGVGGITDMISGSLNVAAPFLTWAGGA